MRLSMGNFVLVHPVLVLHLAVPSCQYGMIAPISCTLSMAGTLETGRQAWESHVQKRPSLWFVGLLLWAVLRSHLCLGKLPAPLRSADFICRTKQKSRGCTTLSSEGRAKAELLIRKTSMAMPSVYVALLLLSSSESSPAACSPLYFMQSNLTHTVITVRICGKFFQQ